LEDVWKETKTPVLIYATEAAIKTPRDHLSGSLDRFVRADNKAFRQELNREKTEAAEQQKTGAAEPVSPAKRKHRDSMDSLNSNRASIGSNDFPQLQDDIFTGLGDAQYDPRTLSNDIFQRDDLFQGDTPMAHDSSHVGGHENGQLGEAALQDDIFTDRGDSQVHGHLQGDGFTDHGEGQVTELMDITAMSDGLQDDPSSSSRKSGPPTNAGRGRLESLGPDTESTNPTPTTQEVEVTDEDDQSMSVAAEPQGMDINQSGTQEQARGPEMQERARPPAFMSASAGKANRSNISTMDMVIPENQV
jgi:hypothetical protein